MKTLWFDKIVGNDFEQPRDREAGPEGVAHREVAIIHFSPPNKERGLMAPFFIFSLEAWFRNLDKKRCLRLEHQRCERTAEDRPTGRALRKPHPADVQ